MRIRTRQLLYACAPLLLVSALALARTDCAAEVVALRQVLAFEPVALAKQNASNGDLRYFEVGRFSRTAPGVEDQSCVRANHLSLWLPGTTDVPCSKAHQALNESAFAYAKQYNEAIKRLRIEQGFPTCGRR